MAHLLQLDPPYPVWTPAGTGFAHILIDNGIEHHLQWVVALDEGGRVLVVQNPEVRFQWNWTMGRRNPQGREFPYEG